MFVYQSASHHPQEGEVSKRTAEGFFQMTERWSDKVTPNLLLVVACALLFGGLSRLFAFLPMTAFVATILMLAWTFAQPATKEEPHWVSRLALASTGVLYLGLGHCLGILALPLIGIAFAVTKR